MTYLRKMSRIGFTFGSEEQTQLRLSYIKHHRIIACTITRCRSQSPSFAFPLALQRSELVVQDQKPWTKQLVYLLDGMFHLLFIEVSPKQSPPTNRYHRKQVLLEYVTLLAQTESHNGLWFIIFLRKHSGYSIHTVFYN